MEERVESGGSGGAEQRPVTYCLIPPELAGKLHELLRAHFADDPGVEVVVEQRGRERRRRAERRRREAPPPAGEERRRIHSATGRRAGERRAALTPISAADAPELPRRARRYTDRIAFAERLEPSTQQAEDRDTARLVTRFQAGDRDAVFTALYTRYFGRVYSYLRVAFRDPHEAEDAAQQVFMRVFEHLPAYERRRQPFRAWLFAIVRNHAVSHLERQRRVEVVDPAEIGEHLPDGPPEELEAQVADWITDRDLSVLVERLPLPQRQALLLRFGFGLTSREVAQVLNREPSDVRMLHHRALEYLRTRLTAARERDDSETPERRRNRSSRRPVPRAEVMRARRYALR